MESNCPNCNAVIDGKFCSNCGQRKYKRIDKKYIWDEIQYVLLHANKGLLYSVKNILKNPGRTAREFVEGKRINHYKPILLVFLLSGIAAFISFKLIGFKELMQDIYSQRGMYSDFMGEALSFFAGYSSFIMLCLIPFFAIFSRIAFRKWGHNYYEHIVMNAYIISFYTLVEIIVLYPLVYFLKNNVEIIEILHLLNFCVVPVFLVWFYKGFYKERSLKSIILKVLLFMLLVFVAYMLCAIAFTFLYLGIYGVEAAERLQLK